MHNLLNKGSFFHLPCCYSALHVCVCVCVVVVGRVGYINMINDPTSGTNVTDDKAL